MPATSLCAFINEGFSAPGGLDPGYFGQGIYFSHDLKVCRAHWCSVRFIGFNLSCAMCGSHWQYVTKAYGTPDHDGFKYVVAAFVCSGSPYPVVSRDVEERHVPHNPALSRRSIAGQAIVPGHDAHIAFVRRLGDEMSSTYVLAGREEWDDLQARGELFSEIVVGAESAQVLPVAILRVRWDYSV
jgi:hypothetical protein